MYTNGFNFNRNVAAIDGTDDAFAQHSYNSFRRFNWIAKQRIRPRAGNERTVRHVVSIRENLSRRRQFQLDRGDFQGATRGNEKNEPCIHGEHGVNNGLGQRLIACRHVIKSAVRLNVVHLGARGCTKCSKSTNLIGDECENLRGAHLPLGPAKILAIGQARMRPDSHALLFGRANGAEDGIGIARVKSAGNICGSNKFQNLLVMLGSFPKIGVEIDDFSHANRACNPARKSAMSFS